MVQGELLARLADLPAQVLRVSSLSAAPHKTHIVPLCLIHLAKFVHWSHKERHDVVQIRVVRFERDVVVPRSWLSVLSMPMSR